MSGPIRPADVVRAKSAQIPEFVFEAFNECIAKHWDGSSANFTQNQVIGKILEKRPDLTRQELFVNFWLDVEDSYRAVGWTVHYDRPGYCETSDANFIFSKPRSRNL
jgi:hypothetical protein